MVVLALHGFPDCLRSFRFQMPDLADAGFRAIAPALRGYEPETAAGGTSIATFHPIRIADDVIAWAEALGPVHLVGHDWGGIVAYLATSVPSVQPGFWQALFPTAHLGIGALILGTTVLWTLRAYRLR